MIEASWTTPDHRICIIGAGPAGLAAIKSIRDLLRFKDGAWTVTAFERRNKIGGIWLPASSSPGSTPPLTPLYDSLTTNLPHPVMAYTSFSFPPSTPLYPSASTVLTYLEAYAAHFDLMKHIRLHASVTTASWDHTAREWVVTVRTETTGEEELHTFDYLIVANGHYSVPRLPSDPGLSQWVDAKKAIHSIYYRNPSIFGDARTVLVVGGGPSGRDLCTDLLQSGRTVVSSVTGAQPEDLQGGRLKLRGRIARYGDIAGGRVTFEDGREEVGIDRCVLATGYQMDFPFLPSSIMRPSLPPPVPPLPDTLHNSTYHAFPLAKHIFPLVGPGEFPPSRAAFLGLPIRVAPLPLVEAQMRAVLRVFETPESLNPAQEAVDIVARYEFLRARFSSRTSTTTLPKESHDPQASKDNPSATDPVERAIASAWLRLEKHEQFEYRDALDAFAESPHRVAPWEIEIYDAKDILREEWRDLERIGKAEEWVRGVGEGEGEKGTEEWIELMRKLLKRADERRPDRSESSDGGECLPKYE